MSSFVAIDFETADHGRDSACAMGLVKVSGGRIALRKHWLIRPPRRTFVFSYIHGITWAQVASKPTFGELWPDIERLIDGADFLAAHNASFDRGVLAACCTASGLAAPRHRFVCTVEIARTTWSIFPTRLPDVCRELGIGFDHHQALSDAEACAKIVLAAERAGASVGPVVSERAAAKRVPRQRERLAARTRG